MLSKDGKRIVVLGATGRQGGQVVRHLLREGWGVRAVTRTPESKKAAALRELGAEVVQADMSDRHALEAALRGAYGLYNMQAPVPGQIDVEISHGRNVAAAAQAADIQHVVYGSAGLGNTPTGIEQWDAKIAVGDAFKEAGLRLTILRPVAFMELMVDPSYFPNASTWYIWPKLTGPDYKIAWISVQDVGAIAARVFADPDRFAGKELSLVADIKSLAECREIYRQVNGRYPGRFPMPMFLFEKFVGKDIPHMWRWLRQHPLTFDSRQTEDVHPGAMDVKTWLQAVREERGR